MRQHFINLSALLCVGLSLLSCVSPDANDAAAAGRVPSSEAKDYRSLFPRDPPFAVSPEEEETFARLWRRSLCLYNERLERMDVSHLARMFHQRVHGCLIGKLKVNRDRPDKARVGVFKNDDELDVTLRYSNINEIADYKPDLRGLAIEVRVPGNTQVQDFLVNDTKRHFASTPEEIFEFSEAGSRGPKGIAAYAAQHPRRFADIVRNQSDKPLSLVTKEFYSRAPFMLGENVIKYAVVPCPGMSNGEHPKKRTATHLSEDLEKNAAAGKICLQFVARFFVDESKTPLLDYTKEWKSDPVVLGTFELPAQEIHTPEKTAACEALVFDPWKSWQEHLPIGPVNKGRWYIYHASRLQSQAETRIDADCSAL